ncbi:MAG: hypothetical protein COX06_02775 [Candidatus Zambryskibacteria bacterium CG22_combo_CG10-13_8_21_14_all_42_17]|uniref:Uncharacterized protein n=1 Tax=Candidatus Zambryskibacteria bacterium CG22_combo_CG10-13_8_21_14_all_42_17 TaxID=1975118 RepID=A0A2H0BCV3_9BACT|nr:MAG: hypothetical protein COX06_02775 [Candidatus Zambryskibacteria bacterium CG22_combo_CG10-13_8_21_14_all_42_17]
MWFSLIVVLFYNPIADLFGSLNPILVITFSWFVVSAGVLFLRNLISILLEANGILTDMHQKLHSRS